MTPNKLYSLLDNAGIQYDVVEIFEGLRTINIEVEEDEPEEHEWSNHATKFIFFKLFDGFDPYDNFPDDQAAMRNWLGEELKEYAEIQVREATKLGLAQRILPMILRCYSSQMSTGKRLPITCTPHTLCKKMEVLGEKTVSDRVF
jgi:hypothetical protein